MGSKTSSGIQYLVSPDVELRAGMGVAMGGAMVMRVTVRVAANPGGAEARGAAWRAGVSAIIRLREVMR